jgi:hypothetical protein
MLATIKETVSNLPDKPFSEFYQDFVLSSQQSILNHDIKLAFKGINSIEDTLSIMSGLNKLTEELNKL